MFSFTSILSLWKKPSTASQTGVGILNLPDELILDIAHHARPSTTTATPQPHQNNADIDIDAPVSLPSDLASLSRTCRVFHAILAPVVLRDVNITSAKRLRSLAAVPAEKLALVKSLSIHLDFDFFLQFAKSIDPSYRSLVQDPQAQATIAACDIPDDASSPSLIHVLAAILSSTSSLESLSIRLAKAQDRPSAWRNFAFRQSGLPFGKVFESALQDAAPSHSAAILLPRLTRVHLDALEDIAPVLRAAPALSSLSVRMLEGFETDSCLRLLDDVKSSAPQLTHLAFSAQNLALPCDSGSRETSTGFDLVEEIGKACPALEELDLRVRTYGHDRLEYLTTFSSEEYSDLAATLLNLPNLKSLHLPGNLLTREQLDALEAPPAHSPESTKVVLDAVAALEREAVQALTVVSPSLERVSFTRANSADGNIVSVHYDVPVSSESATESTSPNDTWQIPANISSSPVTTGGSLFFRPTSRQVLEFASENPAVVSTAVVAALVGAAVAVGKPAETGSCGDLALTVYSGAVVAGLVYSKVVDGAKAVVRAADSAPRKFVNMVTTEVSKRAQVVIF